MNNISIIIPVYNTEAYIGECLNSVINQTYKNLEIIIINDGSTDKSEMIINDYKSKDNRISYYKLTNHGVSYARNYGIKNATGDYIMFVDSDDIVDIRMCEVLINNILNYNADLSICGYQKIKTQKIFHDEISNAELINEEKYIKLFNDYKGFLCNKLYKKDIILRNNIYLNEEISMCEDLLFNFHYLEYTNRICYTKSKLYGYLMYGNNSSKKINQKWFSILYVYNYLYLNSDNLDLNTCDIISLNYLFTLFETRVRCKILQISFADICNKYDINYKMIKLNCYKKIMKNKLLSFKDKLKLFIFYKLFFIAFLIKKHKLLKG